MKNEKTKEIRYFSMFTGVGGFELGLTNFNRTFSKTQAKNLQGELSSNPTIVGDGGKSSPFSCIGFSEIDKYASQLLKNKWPNIKNYGDATRIIPEELPDFELLVGGFPCQSFSIAGKRKGFEDTRGTLFYDIARILKVKRPKHLLLENVKGLLSHDRGRTFATILTTLSELGYVIQWMVLNSKFFGVPQNRERVFIIGSLRGEPIPEILPLRESNPEVVPQSEISNTLISGYHKLARGTTMINMQKPELGPGQIKKIQVDVSGKGYKSQQDRIYLTDGVMGTLPNSNPDNKLNIIAHSLYPRSSKTKQGGTGHLTKKDGTSYSLDTGNMQGIQEGMKIRRLTPIECERLQGFPDNWTEGFSDTQRYKMMGNAVTVNVIKAIVEKLF
ncbi:hypothetical protein LCGC14_0439440 [marine sediment metagenome]|uniref:DNA (cytosine-5-)-methyltransferase n=1 Tax=marine sediment metagenome TaxID=412755 RepID=A0A0F9V7W3_9ZZZZ